jgi:hypothetical protein
MIDRTCLNSLEPYRRIQNFSSVENLVYGPTQELGYHCRLQQDYLRAYYCAILDMMKVLKISEIQKKKDDKILIPNENKCLSGNGPNRSV